jgi:membrane protease YdiL (CAAX protease family)
MSRPIVQLVRDMFSGPNFRSTVVLLTSALCLAAWHVCGSYAFWFDKAPQSLTIGDDRAVSAAVFSLTIAVLLLGVVPLAVVKIVLREPLAEYGVRWGNVRFAIICCVLTTPLILAIGYASAQSPTFQAIYPLNPLARQSNAALMWHIAGQILFYAAWEFHFRGFLQSGIGQSFGIPLGICVQTLASALAHYGKPGAEVFGSIIGGLLWGALAWRTRSLLAGTFQHWLLGAGLDFFICRPF